MFHVVCLVRKVDAGLLGCFLFQLLHFAKWLVGGDQNARTLMRKLEEGYEKDPGCR